MDQADLLTNALEPGERIVWSDRPHGFSALVRIVYGRSPGRGYTSAGCGALLTLIFWACFALIMQTLWHNPTAAGAPEEAMVTPFIAFAAASISTFVNVMPILSARGMLYAVSDKARGFIIIGRDVHQFRLPPPAEVAIWHGAITISDTMLFYGVADPLATLETIREVAARGAGEAPAAR